MLVTGIEIKCINVKASPMARGAMVFSCFCVVVLKITTMNNAVNNVSMRNAAFKPYLSGDNSP